MVVSATEGSWGRHHHLAAFLHDRGGQGSGKLGRWGRRRFVLGPGRRCGLGRRLAVDPGGQLIAAGQRQRANGGIRQRQGQREGGMEVLVGALAAVGVAFRQGGRS